MIATIKDVAEEAGVSISTVSRVINGKPVREKNYNSITEAISKLNYTVNNNARSLRLSDTKTIGFIVPWLDFSYYMSIVKSVQNQLLKSGYSVMVVDTDNDINRENEQIIRLFNYKVDGLIICPTTDTNELLYEISQSIPVVILHQPMKDNTYDTLLLDSVNIVYRAIEKFIQYGHKKIGIVNSCINYAGDERQKGYMRAMEDYHIALEKDHIRTIPYYDETLAYQETCKLLSLPVDQRPTAIFAGNYDITRGVIHSLNDMKVRIPEDISFIGYDLRELQEFYNPKLTMIFEDFEEIGKQLANRILYRINNSDCKYTETLRVKSMLDEGLSISHIS